MSVVAGRVTINEALSCAGIERREAGYLLRAVTGLSQAKLIAEAHQLLEARQAQRFRELVHRRRDGEPLAYLLGTREFYGLEFDVTPAVLIPRPETELLVELTLQRLAKDEPVEILDLGTGSGAIALTIAALRPRARVVAVDVSLPALEVAARNRRRHGLTHVELRQSDWFSALGGRRFDFVVSNPPYVAEGDPHLREGDLRYEPLAALVGGKDGLQAIRRIVREARQYMKAGGWLLLEHGYDQARALRQLLGTAGFELLFTQADLAGHPRVAGGRLTGV